MIKSLFKKPFRLAILLLTGTFSYFCFLLGSQYLNYSLTTENIFVEAEKIYRLETVFIVPGGNPDHMAVVPMGFSPWIYNSQWSQVDSFTSFYTQPVHTIINGKDLHQTVSFVDTNFLSFFKFTDSDEPLMPNQIVLSEKTAIETFGRSDGLINKPYSIPSIGDYTIREVIKLPINSHFTFELLVTKKNLTPVENRTRDAWTSFGEYFYFKADSQSRALQFTQELNRQIDDYLGVQIVRDSSINSSEIWQFDIIPFSSIFYYSDSIGQLKQSGDIEQVKLISIIMALLAIVYLCVQSLAVYLQNLDRKKEIFIRQILGFSKQKLLLQLFSELMLVNLLFLMIASLIFRPATNLMSLVDGSAETWLSSDFTFSIFQTFIIFATFSALVSLLSVVSNKRQYRFELPNSKNSVNNKQRFAVLAMFSGLVASASLIISICGIFFWNHWHSINLNKGFDVQNVVAFEDVNIHAHFGQLYGSIAEELKSYPEVQEVGLSSAMPGRLISQSERISRYNEQDYAPAYAQIISVSDTLAQTLDVEVLHGRFFLPDTPSELWQENGVGEGAIIISQSLASEMGYANAKDAIGQQVSFGSSSKVGKIVGVVANWRFDQAHKVTGPFAMIMNPKFLGNLLIKLNTPLTPSLEEKIKEIGDKWLPSLSSSFVSVDDIWSQQFSKSVAGVKVSFILILTLALNLMISLVAITEFIFNSGSLKTFMSFLAGANRFQLVWGSAGSLVIAGVFSALFTATVLTLSSERFTSADVILLANPSEKAVLLNIVVYIAILIIVVLLTLKKLLKLNFNSHLLSE